MLVIFELLDNNSILGQDACTRALQSMNSFMLLGSFMSKVVMTETTMWIFTGKISNQAKNITSTSTQTRKSQTSECVTIIRASCTTGRIHSARTVDELYQLSSVVEKIWVNRMGWAIRTSLKLIGCIIAEWYVWQSIFWKKQNISVTRFSFHRVSSFAEILLTTFFLFAKVYWGFFNHFSIISLKIKMFLWYNNDVVTNNVYRLIEKNA